jgi:hypothetical protein
MRPITELKGRFKGEDVWIIASGPTAGMIEPGFFDGKMTIGVNRVWKRFDVTFCVIKEGEAAEEAYQAGRRVIVSQHHCGQLGYRLNEIDGGVEDGRAWWFEHLDNQLEQVDLSIVGGDQIVVSYSTITSAMHIAAYMGGRIIILLGHDCGLLDGQRNYEGYGAPTMKSMDKYAEWLTKIEPQSLAVREKLREVYGVMVYSLNHPEFRTRGACV